jgi:hypothetical protein
MFKYLSDKHNNILSEQDMMLDRWAEYFKELLNLEQVATNAYEEPETIVPTIDEV